MLRRRHMVRQPSTDLNNPNCKLISNAELLKKSRNLRYYRNGLKKHVQESSGCLHLHR